MRPKCQHLPQVHEVVADKGIHLGGHLPRQADQIRRVDRLQLLREKTSLDNAGKAIGSADMGKAEHPIGVVHHMRSVRENQPHGV